MTAIPTPTLGDTVRFTSLARIIQVNGDATATLLFANGEKLHGVRLAALDAVPGPPTVPSAEAVPPPSLREG